MQKNWKYLAIGGAALVLVIILIVVLSAPGPDISGRYELLVAGQLTDTVVEINSSSNDYDVKFLEKDLLRSEYTLSKPRGGRFVIEKTADGKSGDRFDLEVTGDGLKGKADISTLAKGIDVFFRKMK